VEKGIQSQKIRRRGGGKNKEGKKKKGSLRKQVIKRLSGQDVGLLMIEILRKLVAVGVGLRESELSLASDPSEGLEVVQFHLGVVWGNNGIVVFDGVCHSHNIC